MAQLTSTVISGSLQVNNGANVLEYLKFNGKQVAISVNGTYADEDGNITISTGTTPGNGALALQINGSTQTTFYANQTSNSTFNVEIPTGAMSFVGESTTKPTESGATVSGHTTWKKGEVVSYDNKEYLLVGNTNVAANWRELGDEGSYALKTITVKGSGVLGGGGDLTTNRTITHNEAATGGKSKSLGYYKFATDAYGHISNTEAFTPLTAWNNGNATIASVANNIVTLKAGVTQTNGAIANNTSADIALNSIAKTGLVKGTTTGSTWNNVLTDFSVSNNTITGAKGMFALPVNSYNSGGTALQPITTIVHKANGSNGKICVGKFNMYDSNLTVQLALTTGRTYYATLVIATQNLNRASSAGSISPCVYGDADNAITPLLTIFRPNPNTANGPVEVYANLPGWSKCSIWVQGIGLENLSGGYYFDIGSTVTAIPTEIEGKTKVTTITNKLTTEFQAKGSYQPSDADLTAIAALSGTGFAKRTGDHTWSLDTNTYYLASNPNGYTSNEGTVTRITINTNGGLTGGSSTAVTTSGTWTIGIDSSHKLPTTTEWTNLSNSIPTTYVKSTSISSDGNSLTITNQAGTTTTFAPETSSAIEIIRLI